MACSPVSLWLVRAAWSSDWSTDSTPRPEEDRTQPNGRGLRSRAGGPSRSFRELPPDQLTPLTLESLRGKVVLVDFWTYSCINCLRTLPYIKAWNEKYKDSGLVIIGVHTPEFPFEKDETNVRKAVKDLGLVYPVPMDNDYKIWRSFNNEYWPADYLSMRRGRSVFTTLARQLRRIGRMDSDFAEEANHAPLPANATQIAASSVEAAPDPNDIRSPETYIGYERAENFASPGGLNQDDPQLYQTPAGLKLNQWAFAGKWRDQGQIATSLDPAASIRSISTLATFTWS